MSDGGGLLPEAGAERLQRNLGELSEDLAQHEDDATAEKSGM